MTTPMGNIHQRGRLILLTAFPSLAGIAVFCISLIGSASPNHTPPLTNLASSARRHFPLEISPDPVRLGVVIQGHDARAHLTIFNRGSQPVSLDLIETTCPCLTIAPASIALPPGESKTLTIQFNSSAEPDFLGTLLMDVTGHARGQLLFETQVKLRVVPASSNSINEIHRSLTLEG